MAVACVSCQGRGVCPRCQGRGVEEYPWGDAQLCAACAGSGACADCGGCGAAALVKPDSPTYT